MTFPQQQPKNATLIADHVAYSWTCTAEDGDNDQGLPPSGHAHTIECLWVWHDCTAVLGPDTVSPGERFGWRPSGVRAHTLVHTNPLTITASLLWPECCGLHGFITDGHWVSA